VLALIDEFQLQEHLNLRFDAMSLGTQKKFLLAAAFIGNPMVIIADEPSNGLDRASRDVLARTFAREEVDRVLLFASHDSDFVTMSKASVVTMTDLHS